EITILKIAKEPEEKEQEKDKTANAKKTKRIGRPYELYPEGIKFDKPVTITLPYQTRDLNGADENALKIGNWKPETKDWETLNSIVDKTEKLVSAKVTHFSIYQILLIPVQEEKKEEIISTMPQAGPSAEFRLGEVYVFPNPAKDPENPVFHIETGIADKVKIIIYTVSGRLALDHTITQMPQMIDDGNGLSYAYEYTWTENIPSGVYYYFIESEKSGQKLKSKGKFAVIR
ncbi:MAG: hypothetical protein HY746_09885, partial [Elusimicrobia bacterium]|nr:hypothetical protein [Elusimicrobiota bacterium]